MDHHEHESEERGLPLQHVMTDTSDRRLALLALALAAVLLIILGVVASTAEDPPMLLFVILGAVAVAAIIAAWMKIRVWAGWSNPQLHLPSSEPLLLGDQVIVRFRRTARGRSDPTGLEVRGRIKVEERATYQQGTDTRTATATVYDEPVEVALHDVVDRVVEADLRLDVPLFAAPPSMDLGDNEVVWELVVEMDAPNAPDDSSTFALEVAPEVAFRLRGGGADG